MAVKLFKLRHVPDDEAEDMRQLLHEHEISFYETEAGGWGISVPAIWIHDADQLQQAQALIVSYQQSRAQQAKADFEQDKEAGLQPTVLDKIIQQPARFILFVLASLFILYVSLAPFVTFLQ